MKGANFLLISFIGVVITSCIGLKNSQQAIMFDKSYCNKQIIPTYTKEVMPKPIWQLNLDSNLTNSFSFQSLNIANAFGMLDDLRNYTSLTANYNLHPTSEQKLSLIESLQQIHQKINIASLEVSAITSELDCEEERAGQFAYYLKEREGRTENKLIISSIIIGAIGAISAEAVSSSKTAGGITIGGSIIEASLGVMMLVNKRKIEFNHTLNALSDIWTNPTVSEYFPPSIWYYLTYEDPKKNEKSLVKLLVDKWKLFGQISTQKEKGINELYFNKGGRYSANDLKNRSDMLD